MEEKIFTEDPYPVPIFDDDIKHWSDYDYVLINKNLEACFKQIEEIIKVSKSKISNLLHTIQ